MANDPIRSALEASIATKQRMLEETLPALEALCERAIQTLRAGGKLMFCGNGGSSCDAAHAAGELIGWFEDRERRGYAAMALGHEVPSLTAISNDVGYEHVFVRQVEALGKPEDMLIGISTSGTSKNVVAAVEKARELGIATAALISQKGGPLVELCDVAVQIPSDNTARIQEGHLFCVHALCGAVERALGS